MGIALIYAKPYRPQGKGKIERFNRTIRDEVLSGLEKDLTLPELNQRLFTFLEETYHKRKHSSTKQAPMERYLSAISLLRSAPANLTDYFRKRMKRTVGVDRSVRLGGRLYEAPVGLGGRKVFLLFDESDMSRIEVFCGEESKGFLKPLDLHVNSRIKRVKEEPEKTDYSGGSLFSDKRSLS